MSCCGTYIGSICICVPHDSSSCRHCKCVIDFIGNFVVDTRYSILFGLCAWYDSSQHEINITGRHVGGRSVCGSYHIVDDTASSSCNGLRHILRFEGRDHIAADGIRGSSVSRGSSYDSWAQVDLSNACESFSCTRWAYYEKFTSGCQCCPFSQIVH